MINILFYGNCQFSAFGKWLSQFEHINVLNQESYNIKTQYPWEKYVFFPDSLDTIEDISKPIEDADYFIFHDVVNVKYIKSLDIYNRSKCPNLCITNFYFEPFGHFKKGHKFNTVQDVEDAANRDILELKRRDILQAKKYGKDYLSMTSYIECNWKSKLLQGGMGAHPTKLYYHELFKILCEDFLADARVTHADPIHTQYHPVLDERTIHKVRNLFPDMQIQ